ncbi:hypothetical protein ACVJGD_004392 [Bradyrhizobium sp. USDA 10063]
MHVGDGRAFDAGMVRIAVALMPRSMLDVMRWQ